MSEYTFQPCGERDSVTMDLGEGPVKVEAVQIYRRLKGVEYPSGERLATVWRAIAHAYITRWEIEGRSRRPRWWERLFPQRLADYFDCTIEAGEALTIFRDHRASLLPRLRSYWRIYRALELRSQGLGFKAIGGLIGRVDDPSTPVSSTRAMQLEQKGRRVAAGIKNGKGRYA